MTAAITSTELRDRLASQAPLWILDVRTPAEFETAHIDGSYNVPLDVLNDRGSEVAEHLDQSHDIVLVCCSGQRASQAAGFCRVPALPAGRSWKTGSPIGKAKASEVNLASSDGNWSARFAWSPARSCCRRCWAASLSHGSNPGWPRRSAAV